MNTDEHGLKMFFWILPFAAVALAAGLLYLQDRYRDYRKIPKPARELAEKKGMIAGRIVFLGILLLGSLANFLRAPDWLQRFGWLVLSAGLAWQAAVSWKAYFRPMQ